MGHLYHLYVVIQHRNKPRCWEESVSLPFQDAKIKTKLKTVLSISWAFQQNSVLFCTPTERHECAKNLESFCYRLEKPPPHTHSDCIALTDFGDCAFIFKYVNMFALIA